MTDTEPPMDEDSKKAIRVHRDRNLEWAIQRFSGTIDYIREMMKVSSGRLLVGNAAGAIAVLTILARQKDLAVTSYMKFTGLLSIGFFGSGLITAIIAVGTLLRLVNKERVWRHKIVRDHQQYPDKLLLFDMEPEFQKKYGLIIGCCVAMSIFFFVVGLIVAGIAFTEL